MRKAGSGARTSFMPKRQHGKRKTAEMGGTTILRILNPSPGASDVRAGGNDSRLTWSRPTYPWQHPAEALLKACRVSSAGWHSTCLFGVLRSTSGSNALAVLLLSSLYYITINIVISISTLLHTNNINIIITSFAIVVLGTALPDASWAS